MPQRQNLKPALADTLRRLRQDTLNGATVAHGIKTVEPGEGLQLLSAEGSEIFWDWETANTWDTRIQEGRAAIEQAERDLAQARLDLDAGAVRVDENRAILDALAPRVDAAESTVAEATKNLGVLEGTVGDVSAAAKAAAKDAKDALYVGLGGNLIPNGDGRAPQGWEAFEWRTTGDTNGQPGMFGLKGKTYTAAAAAAAAGEYQASVSVMGEHDGGRLYAQFEFADKDLVKITAPYLVVSKPVGNGVWTTYSGPLTAPPGTAYVKVRIYPNHSTGVQADDYVWVTGVSLRPLVPGALIVNGSITGKAIQGESVAAEVVRSMTAEHRNLVVTESAILQHTTLLGTTLADELNVRRLLRGRDAILDGTVDINQLNVTGPMAAEIVRMMDAETRRLVVTDDAILNRATIVQSLVTPELIAQKVDARYLRADNIKTGLLEVFGRFRTAPDNQPQIIIQPSQAAWNSKDLAIWFTPDGTTPGGGDSMMYAVTGGMWMNPAGGGGRSESLWTAQQLNLRGQSRAGVRIMDGLTLQTTAGTVGPVINSQGGQFLNIIGSAGASLTTLDGPANIRPYGDVNMAANNGGIYMTTTKARGIALTPGDAGVVFLDQSGSPGYNHTASQAANMYIHSSGKIYRSTSSRRYKKYISDYTFDVTRLRDVRLRKWRDRKQAGQDEDLNWYYGAIAEEIYDLYPEHVPMIADPTWDGDGPAPMIPDSIAYDRLALGAAVAGWQDTDQRLTEAHSLIQSLEARVANLEGASS